MIISNISFIVVNMNKGRTNLVEKVKPPKDPDLTLAVALALALNTTLIPTPTFNSHPKLNLGLGGQ